MSSLDRRSARVHQLISLLAAILLAEVLLVVELEMVLAESELLVKKGTILRESVILGEEKKVVPFSGILPVTWCSWGPFS